MFDAPDSGVGPESSILKSQDVQLELEAKGRKTRHTPFFIPAKHIPDVGRVSLSGLKLLSLFGFLLSEI